MNTRAGKRILITAVMAMTVAGCSMADKKMAPEPQPAPVPAPDYVIEDVNFDFDKSDLKPEATAALNQVAAELGNQADVQYNVVGYTDSIGTKAYNQNLSEERAQSVGSHLMGQGVPGTQLNLSGMGESNPVADNGTREGRAQNRRVEIRPVR